MQEAKAWLMGWMAQVFNFLAGGQYTQAPSPVSPGQTAPLLIDAYGRLVVVPTGAGSPVATGGSSFYTSAGLKASDVVKNTPGALYLAVGTNEGASLRWIMFFNATSRPSNSAVPIFSFPIAAGAPFSLDLPRSWAFTTGIVWAASSTNNTLTYDSGATFSMAVEYL